VLNVFYKPELHGLQNLDDALEKARTENRGLLTVMNHMSVVDDPFMWGLLPWRFFTNIDDIRWGLAASNLCFASKGATYFFSLGKILGTDRFGGSPYQGSIDASIRLLSPDDTLDLIYDGQDATSKTWLDESVIFKKFKEDYTAPIIRTKPSWLHVFPEGYVLQLQPPFSNSMRYFKWGITRTILESTRQPVVLPMFAHGFEKISPEFEADGVMNRLLPSNIGAEIHMHISKPIDDAVIHNYRKEWLDLVKKYGDGKDLTDELKFGKKAQDLRARLAGELRAHVAKIRHEVGFPQEDPRFSDHKWWRKYTKSEGSSDPEVKFIGLNWAIRRLHGLKDDDE
jgi:monolysocardiolipin acyltransferase